MNTLARQIADEIRTAGGAISFARFMEMALYTPGLGYYERSLDQIGRRGDFYTSVSVGPFFGELLAFQFAQWMKPLLAKHGHVQIVEAGAHNGQLAADIVAALQRFAPDLWPNVEYWIIEPSMERQLQQKTFLGNHSNVLWRREPPAFRSVNGIIFSNELLDAMPIDLFRWSAAERRWREMGITIAANSQPNDVGFAWTPLPHSSADVPTLPEALLDVLPDGYTVETTRAACNWWRAAALALAQGRLLTIDYGGTLEELLNPGRTGGTLRGYSRHHATENVLATPGEQDITAHVNFTNIRQTGEQAGLKTELYTTQSQFLTHIARELWEMTGSWPQSQVGEFQTLTHPEHLGRPFRVLVQSR